MFNKFTSPADFYNEWDDVISAWLKCKDPFDEQKNPLQNLNDGTLSLQHLPEPYYGDIDNPSIVIINLNPGTGLCEQCHLRKKKPGILVNDVKGNSYSKMAKVFPIDRKSKNVHMPQESINWWESRLKWIGHILEIRKDMGISIDGNKKPFAIELVPLHSKSFKVSKAAEYVKNKYPAVLGAIEYAITKSDAKMGLAIGKPIYDTLLKLKQFGYTDIDITLAQNAQQPNPNIKSIKRDYRVLENKNNGLKILCTWSIGSNKAPAKDPFWELEKNIIETYFK